MTPLRWWIGQGRNKRQSLTFRPSLTMVGMSVRCDGSMDQQPFIHRCRTPSRAMIMMMTIHTTSSNYDYEKKDRVQRMRQLKDIMENNDQSGNGVDNDRRYWESLWQKGLTPWDLGRSTHVLTAELEQQRRVRRRQQQQQQQQQEGSFRTALLPGCGSGYDVVALARYWDEMDDSNDNMDDDEDEKPKRTVVGLDISPTSLERAMAVLEASSSGGNGNRDNLEDDQRGGSLGKASNTVVQLYEGDFFQDPSTWTLRYCSASGGRTNNINDAAMLSNDDTFDLIFDYTFFCAFPPRLRRQWGRQMKRLLAPQGGRLLTLMFPFVSSPRPDSPGPPYLVSLQDYQDALQPSPGIKCNSDNVRQLYLTTTHPYESKATVEQRKGQELVGWWSFDAVLTDTEPSKL